MAQSAIASEALCGKVNLKAYSEVIMRIKNRIFSSAALASAITLGLTSQAVAQQDWDAINEETLRHFRALLQFDTSDPPGRELPAAEYLRDVLEAEGFEVEMLANNDERPNVVTRLKGNGSKEPLLIMAHTDTVNVDPANGLSRRLAQPSTAAMFTDAARLTTKTISRPALWLCLS